MHNVPSPISNLVGIAGIGLCCVISQSCSSADNAQYGSARTEHADGGVGDGQPKGKALQDAAEDAEDNDTNAPAPTEDRVAPPAPAQDGAATPVSTDGGVSPISDASDDGEIETTEPVLGQTYRADQPCPHGSVLCNGKCVAPGGTDSCVVLVAESSHLALGPSHVYFGFEDRHLARVPKNGGAVDIVCDSGSIAAIVADDGDIYFTTRASGTTVRASVVRYASDGEKAGCTELATPESAWALAVSANTVFFGSDGPFVDRRNLTASTSPSSQRMPKGIWRVPAQGGSVVSVLDNVDVQSFFADAQWLFYTERFDGTIVKTALAGAPRYGYKLGGSIVALDEAHMYYLTSEGLRRTRKDGTESTLLASGKFRSAAVDGASIYLTSVRTTYTSTLFRERFALQRIAKTGGTPETIAVIEGDGDAIQVDATSVYVTTGRGAILKIAK